MHMHLGAIAGLIGRSLAVTTYTCVRECVYEGEHVCVSLDVCEGYLSVCVCVRVSFEVCVGCLLCVCVCLEMCVRVSVCVCVCCMTSAFSTCRFLHVQCMFLSVPLPPPPPPLPRPMAVESWQAQHQQQKAHSIAVLTVPMSCLCTHTDLLWKGGSSSKLCA